MPARSIDSATLSFGLVAIPVKIYSTGEPSHEIHFHLIHAGCGERLHQQYVCPKHGQVERADMAKGYEVKRGNYIEMSMEELKALDAVASDEIAIEEFVPADQIDPLYIERNYYLGAGKAGERAYQLFRDALTESELVAVASYAARGKQYIVALRPYETGLVMHQLRYPDELKPWSEVPAIKHVKAAAGELALAKQVIAHLRRATFDPTRYKDEVKGRVRALIAKKVKGGEIEAPAAEPKAPITDLMAALKASLGAAPRSAGSKRAHAPAKRATKAKANHRTARATKAKASHAPRKSAKSTTRRAHR